MDRKRLWTEMDWKTDRDMDRKREMWTEREMWMERYAGVDRNGQQNKKKYGKKIQRWTGKEKCGQK